MAMPALQLPRQVPVEDRVIRLEVIVETVQSDIADIKIDLRTLRTELREDIKRLENKTERLEDKMDHLEDKMDCLNSTIHSTRLWAIWLYMGLTAGLFSTLAGGFMWMVSELKP